MAIFVALLCAPTAHAQFEVKGGATNLLDKRRAGGSPTVVGGVLTAITVRGGGGGYTSAPAVTIAPPASGATATAVAAINPATGVVTGITVVLGGSGYSSTSPPAIIIAPPKVPTGTPVTLVQFAGQAATSASSGAISTAGVTAGRYPRAVTVSNGVSVTTIALTRGSFGFSFASGVPRYFMGDAIERPSVSWDGAPLTNNSYWRAQPVQPGEQFNSVLLTNSVDGKTQPLVEVGSVTVTKSTTTSSVVEVSSVPAGLTVGATLLGREVQLIIGTTLTLSGPANANIAASTGTTFQPYQPYYFSPHAEKVFASQTGRVTVTWVSAVPDTSKAGETTPTYKFRRETFAVSSASQAEPQVIYWTEKTFDGPMVRIPTGRIVRVNPVFNSFVSGQAVEYTPVGGSTNPGIAAPGEPRTLWFDTLSGLPALRAYNAEGRVFVEYLGSEIQGIAGRHAFLGADIVEIRRSAAVETLVTPLGEQLRPRQSPKVNGDDQMVPVLPSLAVGVAGKPLYGTFLRPDGLTDYFAERENLNPDLMVLYWMKKFDASLHTVAGIGVSGLDISWPVAKRSYLHQWPASPGDYEPINVTQSGADATLGPKFAAISLPSLVFQDDPAELEAEIDGASQRLLVKFTNSSPDLLNRSLLKFSSVAGPQYKRLWIQSEDALGSPAVADNPATPAVDESRAAVYTLNDRNGDGVRDWSPTAQADATTGGRTAATVGSRLVAPGAGYELAGHISGGTCYSPAAYLNPLGEPGFSGAAAGAIIPVNALPVNNQLSVWWFKKVSFPAATKIEPFYVPAIAARYAVSWPENPQELVIASLKGLENPGITSVQQSGSIYRQPDPALPGYNPNEEHGLLIDGNVFALRVDLNLATSSQPFVLLQYTAADNRPAMRVAKVVRETDNYPLVYDKTAGTPLFPPAPLALLPLPKKPDGTVCNEEVDGVGDPTPLLQGSAADYKDTYNKFTFEDRKGTLWLFRGPHLGEVAAAQQPRFDMKFYYNQRADFDFPALALNAQPAPGTIQPFIANTGGGSSFPLTYLPKWPDDSSLLQVDTKIPWKKVPELMMAETLGKTKTGGRDLPQVLGQTSAQVLYQQSMAMKLNASSVALHDPIRAKTSAMDQLPPGVLTSDYAGKTYFQGLPPNLQNRFYYDAFQKTLVLIGEFVDEVSTEDYFNLNQLSQQDVGDLKALIPTAAAAADITAWNTAIDRLSTKLETFRESATVPGTYVVKTSLNRNIPVKGRSDITDPDTAVAGYALSSTGGGTGYVTLVFGNGEAFTDSGDTVKMEIIKVVPELYPGDLKVLLSSNPLDEKVTVRHSGDYGGKPENFEFRYRYGFNDSSGQAPLKPSGNTDTEPDFTAWIDPKPPGGTPPVYELSGSILVGADPSAVINNPAVLMGDVNFMMSYRLKATANSPASEWSDWTRPALVEGWIKRVLAKITPFNQRMSDLYSNSINTDVSLITQAGTRWEGDIALNMENINGAGLIEIYETVLNRGKSFTINSNLDTDSTNNALILAAGYLNDLYTILGNEAYADAANPTISIDDKDSVTEVNTSRFAFEGQVASSLDEELGLLRGRDDFASPGTGLGPAYNRLWWNYTRGINSGEALYAVNYNITEKAGSSTANGNVDAADAQRMFPQGHGDAYGHYLTALKGYYKLLTHPYFTWRPSAETVTVLGVPVSVDYKDERKFAAAAANVGRTAQQVLGLVHRQSYKDDPDAGWSQFRDGKENPRTEVVRHQGFDEAASRSTQGAFFHWVVGNAMLPDVDDNPNHTGVQIVDRTTVPELNELPSLANGFQTTMDSANSRLNPLGLAPGAIAFDLDPNWNNSLGQTAGPSHYEQISARALRALNNAAGSFNQAAKMTRLLRNQENQISDQQTAIEDEEYATLQELYDIYGSPYPGDIGPAGIYPQGYEDPDYLRWNIIDRPLDWIDTTAPTTVTYRYPVQYQRFTGGAIDAIIKSYGGGDHDGIDGPDTVLKTFKVTPNQWAQFADVVGPGTALGKRPYTGALQDALVEAQLAQVALLAARDDLDDLQTRFYREAEVFKGLVRMHEGQQTTTAVIGTGLVVNETAAAVLETIAEVSIAGAQALIDISSASYELLPRSVGLANDVTSAGRGAIALMGSGTAAGLNASAAVTNGMARLLRATLGGGLELIKENTLMSLGFSQDQLQAAYEFEQTYRELIGMYTRFTELTYAYDNATQKIQNLQVAGDTLRLRRETLRQRAAGVINGYRTKDLTFRTFRNEALVQYRTLFDLAGRYSYLATKSYDYETGLLGTPQGQAVINRLVASRSLGDLTGGVPQATTSTLGDAGLAGTMAQINADFSVAKGRLGINNPDHYNTLFSLRQELFRLLPHVATPVGQTVSPSAAADEAWQQTLEQHIVPNVVSDPQVAAYCRGLKKADGSAIPGFIIPFSTTVEDGKNFFGVELAAGDHAYSQSNFATKIAAVGLALPGYIGMADGESTNPGALSATPYAYLIPCGYDFMRTPLGDTGDIRGWQVVDQAMPLPYNLGASAFNTTQFFGPNDTFAERPWVIRKHQAFRMVANPSIYGAGDLPTVFTNSRLIGRSVWNSQWKIVIPAITLLNDEQKGLNNFAASVQDIKLFLRTYSNSGN